MQIKFVNPHSDMAAQIKKTGSYVGGTYGQIKSDGDYENERPFANVWGDGFTEAYFVMSEYEFTITSKEEYASVHGNDCFNPGDKVLFSDGLYISEPLEVVSSVRMRSVPDKTRLVIQNA